jgi:hypothetical protein
MVTDHNADLALAALRAATLGVPELQIDSCRNQKPDSAVFFGRLAGTPVVIKQFPTDGPARVAAMKAELDHVTALMAGTPHRINPCLMVLPQLGAIVLGHAGDLRLSDALKMAAGNRATLMAQAGDWLATYVGLRRRTESFRPKRWLARMEEAALAQGLDRQAPLIRKAARALRQMGWRLAGAPFTRAATHGDFVAINAHLDGGRIIGVDVQGEAWLPLARDIARFLVWQQIKDPAPGPLCHGIAAQDFHAFLSAPLLAGEEVETILPFFIGLGLVQRLAEQPEGSASALNGATALKAWLASTTTGPA